MLTQSSREPLLQLISRSCFFLWDFFPPIFSTLNKGWNTRMSSSKGANTLTVQDVDHHLVGAHHDGGVGDLSYQVGGEAAVQSTKSLLFGNCC